MPRRKGTPAIQKANSTGKPKFVGLPRVAPNTIVNSSMKKTNRAMNKRTRRM